MSLLTTQVLYEQC